MALVHARQFCGALEIVGRIHCTEDAGGESSSCQVNPRGCQTAIGDLQAAPMIGVNGQGALEQSGGLDKAIGGAREEFGAVAQRAAPCGMPPRITQRTRPLGILFRCRSKA